MSRGHGAEINMIDNTSQRSKRHHYVPDCYLRRWADTSGRVVVRRRDRYEPIITATKNVAVEVDLYTIKGAQGPSDEIEKALAVVEGPLTTILDSLAAGEIPAIGSDSRRTLSILLSMQYVRTPENLDRALFSTRAAEHAGVVPVPREAMRNFLHDEHLGFDPDENELSAATDLCNGMLAMGDVPHDQLVLDQFEIGMRHVAPRLESMVWNLERCRKPRFLTSDRPIVLWRPPTRERLVDGIGLEGAAEIRFPVGPSHLLVLTPDGREDVVSVRPQRAAEVNMHLARQCHKLVIGGLERRMFLASLPLAARRPAMRFRGGPLHKHDELGNLVAVSDVIHTWVPDSD